MPKHAALIFNPHAGIRDWSVQLAQFRQFWAAKGWTIDLRPTTHPGHATELAEALVDEGFQLVFAAGGDGTLNEVANGLAGTDVIMAPLPVGTANSFAKEIGLPVRSLLQENRLLAVSEVLARGRVHAMDLGRCDDGRYWLLWASTGADGFVIDQIEPRSPGFKRLGTVGYAAKFLFFLPNFKGIHGQVTVDDRTLSGDFLMVMVSNCQRYAGGEFVLNRRGQLDDGLFEVWIVRGKRWPMLARYTIEVALDSHDLDPNILVLAGKRVLVETDTPAPYHLDAEPAGNTPLACTIQPGALRVLAPAETPTPLFKHHGIPLGALT
jgi:diacylglycerol kinase (ATP)